MNYTKSMRIPALQPPGIISILGTIVIVIALLTVAFPVSAAVEVQVDSGFQQQRLGLGLSYRLEYGQRQTLAQVRDADDWVESDQDSLSFGFAPEPRWIRFGIVNSSSFPQDLLLEIPYPFLDYIDIYVINEADAVETHLSLGDRYQAVDRYILHSGFLAPFSVPENTRYQILMRVSTTSANRIPITLWRHNHYVSGDYPRVLAQSLLYGFFLAISGYHLLLFFSVKEKAYLFWSLSIFGMLCVVLSLDGVATALLWPTQTWPSDYLILLGICGAVGCSALFSYEVLNLAERPKLGLIMKVILMAAGIATVLSFVAPYQLVIKLLMVLGLLTAVSQASVYLIRMFEGYAPARYVVAAIICACVGVVINILTVSGRMPATTFGANSAAIGVALAAIFYSLALSNRMKLERALREQAQLQLTRDLDKKVRERSEALKLANEQLLQASITDSLSGLYNRRHFDEVYNTEYRRAYRLKQSIAVLMMDIDHFKNLNDAYGHPFGDLCITKVATTITSCLNRPPDICARYGGEEFVVVLPNTDLDGAIHVADIINKKVAESPVSDNSQVADISISVGVAAWIPSAPDDHGKLMQQADTFLYKAKERGRNCVAFN